MIFGRRKSFAAKKFESSIRAFTEVLESRLLMSTTSSAALSGAVEGYTPSEIREAYGFDQITFADGTVIGDGSGQTIAIVDAYNDPNVAADLAVFDSTFGLAAPPSLKVVNQTGGSNLPATDSGWAGEIALDVEWAHAIAPGANILLVEASSDDTADLMAAVNYARRATGVSVVSMSWGGSEFFSWGGEESNEQATYDAYFTTPTGHTGVTFIAAAGDSGSRSGVLWPASSSNVVSVGGTSLYTSSDGSYSEETGWSGTSSGYSQVEDEPSYQTGVQSTGARSVSDVSYDADPNTGFAVYCSVIDEYGDSGWQMVGGTSAGAPQWAALIAIANQGRTLAGESTLDGASETLPLLYSLYSATDSSGASLYSTYFNDVDTGGGSGFDWRWGHGSSGSQASTGYDLITGLGTPKAAAIVTAMVGSASTSGTTDPTDPSGTTDGSGTTTPAQLPASKLIGVFATTPITSVLEGGSDAVVLRLTNTDSSKFAGPVFITLYASSDSSVSSDDTALTSINFSDIELRAGASKKVKLKFDYPSTLADGSYTIVASVTATGTGTAAAETAAPAAVTLAPATIDLATAFTNNQWVQAAAGSAASVLVTITNNGNVTATGTLALNFYASANMRVDSSDRLLSSTSRRVKIRAGRSMTFRVRVNAPESLRGSSFFLIASADSATTPVDSDASNDIAIVDMTIGF